MSKPQDTPKELDAIVDMVLAYRPKPKTKAGKNRKRLAKKLAKLASHERREVHTSKSK
jgi:hypothetical protein